ncbi:MAG: hypothetical protein AAGA48_13060 [Myxococcota bacterium]
MMRAVAGLLVLGVVACAKPGTVESPNETPLQRQAQVAQIEGPDQTLERARLASMALAVGETDLAEKTLRQVVQRVQDFRADGEFRALVGQESRKEWKGDPSEKMMAFFYLGTLLLEKGDYGNALAMSKAAILADTGTSRLQYRADFVPAYVLRALAYQGLGKAASAKTAIDEAVAAVRVRVLTGHLTALFESATLPEEMAFDAGANAAARALLLEALPAGLRQHPDDPQAAVRATLSRATELREIVLDTRRRRRPGSLSAIRRSDARRAFDVLGPLAEAWRTIVADDAMAPLKDVAEAEGLLRGLVNDPPSLVLWLESGRAPRRFRDGTHGQILRLQPWPAEPPPEVRLDGRSLAVHPLDSVAFQATTRGGRRIDGFLKGKAVFKDTASVLGAALLVTGDAMNDDAGAVVQLVGAALWLGGAIANPAADIRAWSQLPDRLWLVRAEPSPGSHRLTIGDRSYTVQVPDGGTVSHLIPGREPGGPATFGEPCRRCDPPPAEVPLAIPEPSR